MKVLKGTAVQQAVNTEKEIAIETGLGVVDQKTLWELVAIDVQWDTSMNQAAQASFAIIGTLTRATGKSAFLDDEVISTVNWTIAAGAAPVAVQGLFLPLVQRDIFVDKPLVANSKLFFIVESVRATVPVSLSYKLYYNENKVSELEFLKAQTGYCVC